MTKRETAAALRAVAEAFDALASIVEQASDQPTQIEQDTSNELVQPALLSVKQAAAYLGMSPSFVYQAVEAGRLPSVRLGSRVRLRVADLDAFVAERTIGEYP